MFRSNGAPYPGWPCPRLRLLPCFLQTSRGLKQSKRAPLDFDEVAKFGDVIGGNFRLDLIDGGAKLRHFVGASVAENIEQGVFCHACLLTCLPCLLWFRPQFQGVVQNMALDEAGAKLRAGSASLFKKPKKGSAHITVGGLWVYHASCPGNAVQSFLYLPSCRKSPLGFRDVGNNDKPRKQFCAHYGLALLVSAGEVSKATPLEGGIAATSFVNTHPGDAKRTTANSGEGGKAPCRPICVVGAWRPLLSLCWCFLCAADFTQE